METIIVKRTWSCQGFFIGCFWVLNSESFKKIQYNALAIY